MPHLDAIVVVSSLILLLARKGHAHCDLKEDMKLCHNYEMIAYPEILHFGSFPGVKFQDICKRYKRAFNCALAKSGVDKCTLDQIKDKVAQRNVFQLVCETKKEAFMASKKCFMQNGLETELSVCLDSLYLFDKHEEGSKCKAIKKVRKCAIGVVSTSFYKDACHQDDIDLLELIVEEFLQPFAEVWDCGVAPNVARVKETTTMETTPTTTSTSTTINTTASTSKDETPTKDTVVTPVASAVKGENSSPGLSASFTTSVIIALAVSYLVHLRR